MMKGIPLLGILMLCSSSMICAQTTTESPAAIQDNSFFVEEAFNQEAGVVQHIFNVMHFNASQQDFSLSFTQEWPLFSPMHQLSFTMPYMFLNSNAFNGIGDMMINYRYQLFSREDGAAVAPRVSLIFPTGDFHNGTGSGCVGVQINISVSKQLSDLFIMYFNAGVTHLPNAKATDMLDTEVKRSLTTYNLASSVIWLARSDANILLEYAQYFSQDIDENGNIISLTEVVLNPGLRFAVNMPSLQIVPGVGMPISISNGNTRTGMFLYLSFEHPF